MRSLLVVIGLIALLPTLSLASDIPLIDGVRIKAGYFDMGDLGKNIGVGADVKLSLIGFNVLAGVEAGDGADLLDLNANIIWQVPMVAFNLYYGAGPGWYRVNHSGGTQTSFGGQAVVGAEFGSKLFVEGRYVFLTDFNKAAVGTGDVDGLHLCAGLNYKF